MVRLQGWGLKIKEYSKLHIIYGPAIQWIYFKFLKALCLWRRGIVAITAAQIHSTKAELRFCVGSNPVRSVSEIRNVEDFWQWFWVEKKLNTFCRSIIPERQIIISPSSSSSSGKLSKVEKSPSENPSSAQFSHGKKIPLVKEKEISFIVSNFLGTSFRELINIGLYDSAQWV